MNAPGFVLLAFLGILPAPSPAAQESQAADRLRMMVEHELQDEEGLQDVKVTVRGNVVTLDGTVPSLGARNTAIEEAGDVSGVETVVSNLTIAAAESDASIGREIARRIRNYVFYTIFDDVTTRVQDGVVTLTGAVTQPYRSTEIARLASRVRGVTEVRNEIEILPVSSFDDQIRASLASRIYGHTVFSRYAVQPNPPVHIVVRNGHVTLTGVVSSTLESRVAEMLARQAFGVFSVTNALRVEGSDSDAR